MDPALWELLETGERQDEVAAIIRLEQPENVPAGVRLVSQFGHIATIRLPRETIPDIWAETAVASLKAPRIGLSPELDWPLLEEVMPEKTIDVADSDRRHPESLRATGRGVVLGVIDWGFDFVHPDFVHPDGSTRILALWDQRSQPNRDTPQPYGYGVVYRTETINQALQAENPYDALGYRPAPSSHATHVASIAGGNGRSGGPPGVAPAVEFVFVHLSNLGSREQAANLGDAATLLEAVDFIAKTAGDRPCVINTSLGRHGEQHDGSTLVEQGLDAFVSAVPGRAVVQSCGNYYSQRIHTSGRLRPGEQQQFIWKVDPADLTPNELEVWYAGRDRLTVELRSQSDDTIQVKAELGDRIPLKQNGQQIGSLYHRRHEPNTQDNHIDIFLYPHSPAGDWEVTLTGTDVVDGSFHAWVERDSSLPHSQSRLDRADVVTTSTTGTICNGFRTIAVGAYNPHSSQQEIAPFSSAGPTRDGRIKPDIAAPGVMILAARSTDHWRSEEAPLLMRKSGTSMAAPHVAGTVALMFEAAGRLLPIEETRRLLLMSADAVDHEAPERVGSGYLNIERAVAMSYPALGEQEIVVNPVYESGESPMLADKTDQTSVETVDVVAEENEITVNAVPKGDVVVATADVVSEEDAIAHSPELEESYALYEAVLAESAAVQLDDSCTHGDDEFDDGLEELSIDYQTNVSIEGGDWEDSPEDMVEDNLDNSLEYPDDYDTDFEESDPDSTYQSIVDLADWAITTDTARLSPEAWLASLVRPDVASENTAPIGQEFSFYPAAIFDAFSAYGNPHLRRYYEQFFEVVAAPGQPAAQALAEGQIVVRRALGEGNLAHVAMLVSGEIIPKQDLVSRGLQAESAAAGGYAHILEAGAFPHGRGQQFARRIVDQNGYLPANQMVLQARPAAAPLTPAAGEEADFLEAAPRTIFRIRNRIITTDPVTGCTVEITRTGVSVNGRTNRFGSWVVDLSSLADGTYRLRVLPDSRSAAPVGPNTASTAPRPTRIWRSLDATITMRGGRLVSSSHTNISISGRNVSIGVQPVWMQSPNRSARPANTSVTHIVVHHTAGTRASSAIHTFMNSTTSVSAHYVIDVDGQIIKMVDESDQSWHAGRSHWGGQNGVNAFSVGIEVVHRSGAYPVAQYTALLALLPRIQASHATIKAKQIIGHSDVATTAGSPRRVGRKLGDPGPTFEWTRLAAAGLGLPIPSSAHLSMMPIIRWWRFAPSIYGEFFKIVSGGRLRNGDRDSTQRFGGRHRPTITTAVIAELQTDLQSIGYFCPVNGRYDRRTQGAVQAFQEHFLSRTRPNGHVDEDTAEAIKFVRP